MELEYINELIDEKNLDKLLEYFYVVTVRKNEIRLQGDKNVINLDGFVRRVGDGCIYFEKEYKHKNNNIEICIHIDFTPEQINNLLGESK